MHNTLCDLITDLTQNSIEAEATRIILTVNETTEHFGVEIIDNGKGMDEQTLAKATDPFFTDGKKHAHRKVGLGLPFLLQTVEMTEGEVSIKSKPNQGTTLRFKLNRNHIDLPEPGNFATSATTLLSYNFNGELIINRNKAEKHYRLSKNELTEVLGDLNELDSLTLLRQFIETHEEDLDE